MVHCGECGEDRSEDRHGRGVHAEERNIGEGKTDKDHCGGPEEEGLRRLAGQPIERHYAIRLRRVVFSCSVTAEPA